MATESLLINSLGLQAAKLGVEAARLAWLEREPALASLSTWLLVIGIALALSAIVALQRGVRRRRTVAAISSGRRMSDASKGLLMRLASGDYRTLEQPDELRRALAEHVLTAGGDAAAAELARNARTLMIELGLATVPFDGAPLPFEPADLVALGPGEEDATPLADSGGDSRVHGFLVQFDERCATFVSRDPCPWSYGQPLLAQLSGRSFRTMLLMRPSATNPQWQISHELVDPTRGRRSSVRTPCRLPAVALPDGPTTRELLSRSSLPSIDAIRASHAWAQRRDVLVTDVSEGGAGMIAAWTVRRGERCVLIIPDLRPIEADVLDVYEADALLATDPLAVVRAEVVSLRSAPGGRAQVGLRFTDVDLANRSGLARSIVQLAARASTTPSR